MSLYTEARSWRLLKAGRLSLLAVLGLGLWAAVPAHATFPGANGKIVMQIGDGAIWTVNPDGTAAAPLEHNCCDYELSPAWSPDGTKLALGGAHASGCCGQSPGDIYLMNPDGSDAVDLTNNSADDREPAWSPDGRRIAFLRNLGDIYVMHPDGTNVTLLAHLSDAFLFDLTWSPDGSKLAFTLQGTTPTGAPAAVYTIDPDGGGLSRLAAGWEPSWSPDGARIAYATQGDIHLINPDGAGDTVLTETRGASEGDLFPTWSPDGSKIVFLRYLASPPSSALYTMIPDGSGQSQLTPNFVAGDLFDWQPIPSFKNASKKCKALPGDYRNHGQCVKASK
jgi:Tol biopolymer transport system component